MISFDFEYYRPASVTEAANVFERLASQGKQALYYGGGTEIITMARAHLLRMQAVIDIKGIPECNALQFKGDRLVIGAAVTLTRLSEANVFPLLSATAGRAADRTNRNKITLGGNICSKIIYREAVLPLLLADSEAVIAGPQGIRRAAIGQIFHETIRLQKGEFLVQLVTERSYTALPFYHVKKTKLEEIDYPLVTLAALKKDGRIRATFSGVCAFPFRSPQIEEDLNDKSLAPGARVRQAVGHLPAPLLNDVQGSAEYREFVLKNALLDALETLEGVPV